MSKYDFKRRRAIDCKFVEKSKTSPGYLKYEVTDLEQELNTLNRSIEKNHEGIHVLKAEWSHLNDTARIKNLATRYLEMHPTDPKQILTKQDLKNGLNTNAEKKEHTIQINTKSLDVVGSPRKGQ